MRFQSSLALLFLYSASAEARPLADVTPGTEVLLQRDLPLTAGSVRTELIRRPSRASNGMLTGESALLCRVSHEPSAARTLPHGRRFEVVEVTARRVGIRAKAAEVESVRVRLRAEDGEALTLSCGTMVPAGAAGMDTEALAPVLAFDAGQGSAQNE